MWSLFASNGNSDDLAKENQRLAEHLALVLEDYELLKEAHRRVLEQMLPMHGASIPSDTKDFEAELNKVAARLGETAEAERLRKVIDADLKPIARECKEERLRLLQLREALRLKQQEIEEQEYDLSHALHELRTRQTESTLEQSIQHTVELSQTIDSLKREITNKDAQIAQLSKQFSSGREVEKDKERIKRAIQRVATEVHELKCRCSFEVFSKQLSATKDFLSSELQRLTRRISGLFKERQKLQERLDAERRTWKETEASIRSKLGFELEQLQKRVNRPVNAASTQTEHYLEEADSQQAQLWGADSDLELPELPEETEAAH